MLSGGGWGKAPRQKRLEVLGGFCQGQFAAQVDEVGVGVDAVGLAGFDQRVQVGAGAPDGVGEQPVAATYGNCPAILPISGMKSKSITVGIHCMGAESNYAAASNTPWGRLSTWRPRPAW
jgi:hypothetical protein